MTATAERPTTTIFRRPSSTTGLWSWITTVDHKRIGILYGVTSFIFFIIGGARTPMTDYVGALKDVSALELGAIASRAAFDKTGVRPEWVDGLPENQKCG